MLDIVKSPDENEEGSDEFLSKAMESAIRDHLKGGQIVSVESSRSAGFDGDDIITVTIVVTGRPSDFPAQRLASLIGKLRSTLEGIDEYAFPMVSFMSPREFADSR